VGDAGFAVEAASKRYGDVTALSAVSVTVAPGRFHGLVGPNGSGKTTLFHLLSGLARPTGGRVRRPPVPVGVGFQVPRFYPDLTVRENLSVFRSFAADPPPADWTETLLEALRLDPAAHRKASDLSGGFRTKLDLALAMVKRPRYLLLDEPLTDVDDYSRRRIVAFLADYPGEERSVVVSTHNVEAFADAFDRLTVLADGTVAFDGPVDDPVARYRAALE